MTTSFCFCSLVARSGKQPKLRKSMLWFGLLYFWGWHEKNDALLSIKKKDEWSEKKRDTPTNTSKPYLNLIDTTPEHKNKLNYKMQSWRLASSFCPFICFKLTRNIQIFLIFFLINLHTKFHLDEAKLSFWSDLQIY